jgi:hypothetical protein
MKISKTHQLLCLVLKTPKVITNPQKFLGPNWETVLRWWLYWESLTDDQRNELVRRYWAIDNDTHNRAYNLARDTVLNVIVGKNRQAVYNSTQYPAITYELITMHLLFERGHSLTFVPLIKDL